MAARIDTTRTGAWQPGREASTAAGEPKQAEVRLRTGQLWRLIGNGRRAIVRCLEGMLWVTQEGDPEDHLLRAGETFATRRQGLVLVQAMREASVRIAR